ncbi:dihydrolipoyllysine-residue acetyltransferase [Mangrovimicrobium sediminis]|uniref:Acetyltransferase component of pyruvate dehydrogenase complex n=1 Tax=Mangrovimicrobium sediminis TaxID=2562682 RepID=A0A4Z0M485_9GAMM|nr:dihydrolipoyllysine-residue acetyltransferase [Haliea sp. SAOS-164]TGD74115.1 dihydrolipoyllysine-residue acetyltransferase [Haliea sp. SAOS-164]
MAREQVTVPDIGGGEAEVIEVLVQVGDQVTVDQGLIVMESDKASMEIPSTVAGEVVELLVSEGQQLAEGATVAVISSSAEAASSAEPEPAQDAAASKPAEPQQQKAEPEKAAEAPAPKRAASGGASTERVVPVPDIGTDDAVDLVEVCVAVGDSVAEGDSLVVLESDKASMEVPAPFAGEVLEIRVSEGRSVRQGDELMVLRSEGDAPAAAEAPASENPAEPKAPKSETPAPAQEKAQAQAQVPTASPAAEHSPGSAVYAGPAVRKLAREFGIDLGEVSGSGPRGRIVKEDLQNFTRERLRSAAPAAPASGAGIPAIPEVDFSAFGEVEVTQRSKLDKLTAANMQRSWLNVPHVTQYDDADITDLEAFRAGLKAEAEKRGTRLTPLPFMLKACAVALRDNPKFRSSLADGGDSLVYKQYIHIGMAVDTPAGLLVPVILDVDKKGIWELAEEVLELAGKARERKLTAAQMQGGCFTISSLGAIGGTGFSPIINTPEVGILGVSRARMAPVWDGEAFVPRQLLPLALSYDHRVVNGGDAGRFMTQLVALLGDIRSIIL